MEWEINPLVVLRITSRFSVYQKVTLKDAAIRVLNTPHLERKAYDTLLYVQAWQSGVIEYIQDDFSASLTLDEEPPRTEYNDDEIMESSAGAVDGYAADDGDQNESIDNNVKAITNMNVRAKMRKNSIECTIHAIANAESYAIDLFWDLISRYTGTRSEAKNNNFCSSSSSSSSSTYNNSNSNGGGGGGGGGGSSSSSSSSDSTNENQLVSALLEIEQAPAFNLPLEFYDDMMYIVAQEAEHFLSWLHRLRELQCPFGTFPISKGLWQSAAATAQDILARLAIINLTHEAKGLDSYPKTREKFLAAGDTISVEILDHNIQEEIHHVAMGVKWFTYLSNNNNSSRHCCSTNASSTTALDTASCDNTGTATVTPTTTTTTKAIERFHSLSKQYFKGKLKPPFHREFRRQAGLTEDWYIPLT